MRVKNMFCKNCGTKISEIVKFCPNCGTNTDSFSPIEKSDHEIIYKKCISKSVYYFNLVAIWLIIVVNVASIIIDGKSAELGKEIILNFGFALGWFWIAPSGVRRVYNKSRGSKISSNIAFLLCTWFNIIGWVICWIYEKL